MARVTVSKAIKLAGVSRSTFYTSYINKGKITVSSDHIGKKYIETSELIRVFGTLQGDIPNTPNSSVEHPTGQDRTPSRTPDRTPVKTPSDDLVIEVARLKTENDNLKEQHSKSQEREAWYQAQIQSLTDTMKLLEGPKQSQPSRHWWQFWK